MSLVFVKDGNIYTLGHTCECKELFSFIFVARIKASFLNKFKLLTLNLKWEVCKSRALSKVFTSHRLSWQGRGQTTVSDAGIVQLKGDCVD